MSREIDKVGKIEIIPNNHGPGWLCFVTLVSERGGSMTFPVWGIDDRIVFETYSVAMEVCRHWLADEKNLRNEPVAA